MARNVRFSLPSLSARSRALTRFSLCSLALVAPLLAARPADAQGACQPAIQYGMNPSFQNWSSRAIVFADAFQRVKTFFYWNDGPLDEAPLIALGSGLPGAGWPDPARLGPGQRYGSMLFGQMDGTLPDGRVQPYVVTWNGKGHVMLEGPSVVAHANRSAARVEVHVDPTLESASSLLSISWTALDPADPVRNVHVWLPGMERGTRIFWPPFVDKLKAMNAGRGPHTWRTLDWTRVNDYGRPPAADGFVFDRVGVIGPGSPSQGTARGVALEYQIALCNLLGMNLHLQLPHRTKDMTGSDYAAFLYEQLRIVRDGSPGIPGLYGGRAFAGLEPALTVTVELSNEIWNGDFPVSLWMNLEALRRNITYIQQVAGEVQLLFDTAEAVFEGPNHARLRTYVGGFSAAPTYAAKILAFLRPGTQVDALGSAAYLGPQKPEIVAWLVGSSASACPNCPDTTALLDSASARVESLRPKLRAHREIADAWLNPDGSNPAFELYEGGMHLRAHRRPWAAAGRAAQTDPRVFEMLTNQYVPMLMEEGVELLNWYSFMSDQDAPRVDAHGIWNDMDQELTLPVQQPYEDEGAPKAAVVYLGPPLAGDCPRARAFSRQASDKAPVLTATPPVLGATFRAEVELASAGERALVLGSRSSPPAASPSGPKAFGSAHGAVLFPAQAGPVAAWSLRLPNDPALAGLELTIQAVVLGGSRGIRLSNAVDLTFGI
ncbi:MAG: hypothetical protein HOP15_02555 [Planctomycetes bacterium]|nr:hypothetical protein [Planctomycetota bacterium]